MTYIPFEPMIERSQMTAYLEKFPISCQSGANLPPIKRKSRWDILTYFPFALWIEVAK